jgi:natural product biosynthesis luciferase-like monooxygenase protein
LVEDWSVVDALSNGRVGLSLATGWNKADFVLAPDRFEDRRERTLAAIEPLRQLWSGTAVPPYEVDGDPVEVRVHPRAVQAQLPLWLTATSGPATFVEAGRRGLNVLTGYLQQDSAQLERNVATYRAERAAAGPGRPHVTLMMHTYVAETAGAAAAAVRRPLLAYLEDFLDLNARGQRAEGLAGDALTSDERQDLAEWSLRMYLGERSLVGGPAEVAGQLERLASIGIDEVACFVDFGLPPELALASLRRLAAARAAAGAVAALGQGPG